MSAMQGNGKPFMNSMLIRTLCNAWCTSYRLHEPNYTTVICPCCGGPDRLSHYLVCKQFWLTLFPNDPIVQSVPFTSPLQILGIDPWNPLLFRQVAIASIVYHDFKHAVPQFRAGNMLSFDLAADAAAASSRLRSRRQA